MTTEIADLDNRASTVIYCPATRRRWMDLELFDAYWRDVHGPTCARMPGLWQYTQFHLHQDTGGVFPSGPGVGDQAPPAGQIDGVAELTFLTRDDANAWLAAAGGILARDEQNVFESTIVYWSHDGDHKTVVDRTDRIAPNGTPVTPRFHLTFTKKHGVSHSDLRAHVDALTALHASAEGIRRLRTTHFEEYDPSTWQSENVEHDLTDDATVHAAIEIEFESMLSLRQHLASASYLAALKDQADVVQNTAAFREREVIRHVASGDPTLAGRRGATIARTIESVGAFTNLRDDIVALFP